MKIPGRTPPAPADKDDERATLVRDLPYAPDLGSGHTIVSTAETMAAPMSDARSSGQLPAEDAPPLVGGRYEILGMLGGGAMGTVYRARDRELDEIVALKVLRTELASSPEMLERFRREVKLARRVTHRNVARTYDIGEHAGDRFLTMELVRGEGLGNLLARRGQLDVPTVAAIGRDVAAGLGAAHAAGVLHRDLKPENVVLAEDGRAVITDFGIARAARDASEGEVRRTAAGGIVGTPAYMAPEQVEGKDLDARSDLYALGTMLYELLTGALAWPGESVMAVATARLVNPPPDPRVIAPGVSAPMAELVLQLMARDRDARVADAAEAEDRLAALVGSKGTAPARQSRNLPRPAVSPSVLNVDVSTKPARAVAVLPITNLGLADDTYLTQSVTEDLVDLLSVIPNLRVLPRGHTARFSDPARDVRAVGLSLEVDVVVDASLRRIGEEVRVSVRLISVADGFQLWARRFDRSPSKVLTVADEAASAIAHALTTEREPATVSPRGPTDSLAQEFYLRGRYLMNRGWFETAPEAARLLRDAAARAPDDARILGTFALALGRQLGNEPNYLEIESEARRVAERALELQPNQPEARVALGLLHHHACETTAAVRDFKRALRVNPNQPDALDSLGRILVEVGRTQEGMAMLERALAVDPEMSQARYALARIYGIFRDAPRFNAVLGAPPKDLGDLPSYLLTRGRVMLWNEDVHGARALAASGITAPLQGYARVTVDGMIKAAAKPGLDASDMELLRQVVPHDRRVPPRRICFLAQIRTEMKVASGDPEGALEDLRMSDGVGLVDLVWLDRCHLLRKIRPHPTFQAVRANVLARAIRVIEACDAAG